MVRVGEMCVDMCALTQPHTHTMLLKTTENVYPMLRNNQVTGTGPELFQTRDFLLARHPGKRL